MSTGILEAQPTDPTEVAGWLDRLHTAAIALLPEQFTVNVPWNDNTTRQPLPVTFTRLASTIDPDEFQYRVLDPLAVPHRDSTQGDGVTTIPAGALAYSGYWLNSHVIRRPLASPDLTRDFSQRIRVAVSATHDAEQAITLLELARTIRLRQRVGETDIRNGGHDTDIARLQAALSGALAD